MAMNKEDGMLEFQQFCDKEVLTCSREISIMDFTSLSLCLCNRVLNSFLPSSSPSLMPQDVIIKTLIAAHPILCHNYRSCFPNHTRGSACFEILGFDVLLDRKLKPWLLEVGNCGVVAVRTVV